MGLKVSLIFFILSCLADLIFISFRPYLVNSPTSGDSEYTALLQMYLCLAFHELVVVVEFVSLLSVTFGTYWLTAGVYLSKILSIFKLVFIFAIIRFFLTAFPTIYKYVLIPRRREAQLLKQQQTISTNNSSYINNTVYTPWDDAGYVILEIADFLFCIIFILTCANKFFYLTEKTLYPPFHAQFQTPDPMGKDSGGNQNNSNNNSNMSNNNVLNSASGGAMMGGRDDPMRATKMWSDGGNGRSFSFSDGITTGPPSPTPPSSLAATTGHGHSKFYYGAAATPNATGSSKFPASTTSPSKPPKPALNPLDALRSSSGSYSYNNPNTQSNSNSAVRQGGRRGSNAINSSAATPMDMSPLAGTNGPRVQKGPRRGSHLGQSSSALFPPGRSLNRSSLFLNKTMSLGNLDYPPAAPAEDFETDLAARFRKAKVDQKLDRLGQQNASSGDLSTTARKVESDTKSAFSLPELEAGGSSSTFTNNNKLSQREATVVDFVNAVARKDSGVEDDPSPLRIGGGDSGQSRTSTSLNSTAVTGAGGGGLTSAQGSAARKGVSFNLEPVETRDRNV